MDYNLMKNNKVFISGEVASEPKFSHEVYGENFFEFDLKVPRLSDSFDKIPVTVSERLLVTNNIQIGSKICGNGQFRSYNKLVDEKWMTCRIRLI